MTQPMKIAVGKGTKIQKTRTQSRTPKAAKWEGGQPKRNKGLSMVSYNFKYLHLVKIWIQFYFKTFRINSNHMI